MLNKAILMGRLTADPELRRTQSNTAVTSFTLAVDRSFSKGAEKQTDFIDIVAWDKTAEFVSKWFHKGQLVAVSGRIQVRNWEDKQGQKRRTYEIVAEEAHFAESKRDTQYSPEGGAQYPQYRDTGSQAAPDNGGFREIPDDDGELPF
ncbi:MAG: single-stranded DNA-binding protein [Clostridia bacterium]|nr:single-stranded DNA-binding protein [Clostridia bacterium]